MKKIKILTLILVIVLVTMVAFGGVFIQVQNRMEDKVKDYSYAMDLEGRREIRLKVDETKNTTIKDKDGNVVETATDEEVEKNGYTKEETPVNKEETLTKENYKKTKEILEKRLKKLEVQNYNIRLDETSGDIVIELTQNDDVDTIISNIEMTGKFEIADATTKETLMDNNDIKLSNVLYNTETNGTRVYLNIEFTKDGAKKLENITNTYVPAKEENTTTENNGENTENQNQEQKAEDKKISMKIDDNEIMSTSFDEPIKNGKMQLTIGQASTEKKVINEYVAQAKSLATVLDTEKLPIKYTLDGNKYIESDITKNDLKIVEIAVAVVAVIALLILIVKYKLSGFLAAVSYVGLASCLLLTIRYTNVVLSIEGICGIILVLILNYIFTAKLLSKIKENKEVKKTFNKTLGEFFVKIIPVCILTIAFCFIQWIPISSFGMVMFWGLVIIAIYNIVITKNLLRISEEK